MICPYLIITIIIIIIVVVFVVLVIIALKFQLDHVQALDTFKCGSNLIQNIGISHRSPYQTHPAQLKYFNNCGTAPKLKVHGFKISEGAEVGKGEFIYAAHFLPGQFVDVIGKR